MRIVTWNVNSIAVRLPLVADFLGSLRPDIVCLQETKCPDERFPAADFASLGYESVFYGQPTYNGVAILARSPVTDVERGFPDDDIGSHRRLIAGTVNGVRVINVYIPNGSEVGSEKYAFKLAWMAKLRKYLDERCSRDQLLVLCGDFNVAPEARDVHDPELWEGRVLFSEPEREALKKIADWGLVDLFRVHHSEGGHYSWWDYRGGGFRRNHGLRIDHLWATGKLAALCTSVEIDRTQRALERPSDHAPVIAGFKL